MKDPFHWQIKVLYLWKVKPEQRQEYPLCCLAHVAVLHWRLSNYCCRVYQILSMRNAVNMEYRVMVCSRIKPCMVSKRAFNAHLAGLKIALYYKLAVRRNLNI